MKMDKYRPPDDSDSDDGGYDGFYFGDDEIKPVRPIWRADSDQKIYDAVVNGEIDVVRAHLAQQFVEVNVPLHGGNTLLHHACQHGHFEIVRYLLHYGADPNKQVDSFTPLMSACSSNGVGPVVKDIVSFLIDAGAVVNISNKHGVTPFMYACIHGHVEVVKFLLRTAFLEATDNQGWTALFHAIENNRPEIVKILVDARANVNAVNRKGYLPRQVAQFHGFYDILEILPPEKYEYVVPTNFLCYSKLSDIIPRLFLKTDIPEYFPDIDAILRGARLDRFVKDFAKNNINLCQFLTMTEERLSEIGIELPLHRKKILLCLLKYHLEHWSIQQIPRVKIKDNDSFLDILMIISNHLKTVVIITSSLQYIQQNIASDQFGPVAENNLNEFRKTAALYRKSLHRVQEAAEYLRKFSPERPPLYISHDEMLITEARDKARRYLNYSIVVGIAIIGLLKWKNFI